MPPRYMTRSVRFRVTPGQYRKLKRLSGSRGLARWIREKLLDLEPSPDPVIPDPFAALVTPPPSPVWYGNQFQAKARWNGCGVCVVWRRVGETDYIFDWKVDLDGALVAKGESKTLLLAKTDSILAVPPEVP